MSTKQDWQVMPDLSGIAFSASAGVTITPWGNDKPLTENELRLLASAPDLLAALQEADKLCGLAVKYFPKSIRNGDTFTLLNVRASAIRAAIAKATGVQQ